MRRVAEYNTAPHLRCLTNRLTVNPKKCFFSEKLLILAIFYCATGEALINDPFNTEALTPKSPDSYWIAPRQFKVDDTASQLAKNLLPHRPLSLAEVTDFALRNNPNTRLAWAQAKVAAASLGNAESSFLPQVNVGWNAQYNFELFKSNSTGTGGVTGPNISLSYLLLDFGTRLNTVRTNRYAVMAANFSQNSAIQQLILQIEQAYYQLLGQQALITANQQSVKEAKISVDASTALRSQGMATIGDVYQAESSLAQSELNLEQAKGNFKIAQGQLATAMGLPAETPFELTPLSAAIPQDDSKNIDRLMAAAKRNRPDLLAQEATVRQSQAQLAATKAQALPTVSLNAQAGPLTIDNAATTNTSISLSLTVPIFTGFSQTYQVNQATAEVLAAAATRDALIQQISLQVWQAYYLLQTAAVSIKSADIYLKSSQQASEQARGQYQAGVGNILSVLSTQSALANARVQSIQARLNWYIGLSQLAHAVGALDTTPRHNRI